MNCERAKKMLVEYSEGVLAEGKKSAVESHLAGCEACRGELSQIERLKGSLLSLDVPERDAEFWRRFSDRLSQRLVDEEPAPAKRPLLWRAGLPIAATAVAALVVAILMFRGPVEPPAAVPDVARRAVPAVAVESADVGYETFGENGYGESLLAMVDYSNGDIEEIAEDMFLLIEEDLQAASEDMIPYDIYEQSIYDFLDDLSPDELDDVYEGLASI